MSSNKKVQSEVKHVILRQIDRLMLRVQLYAQIRLRIDLNKNSSEYHFNLPDETPNLVSDP